MRESKLDKTYPLRVRIITVLVVLGIAGIFYAFPKLSPLQKRHAYLEPIDEIIEQLDIPETFQYEQPPAPARPSIPIPSENEDIAEDITIAETDLADFEDWLVTPPPPPEPETAGREIKFIPYDEAPTPIGGYEAIRRRIVYPSIAREAGIEGTVILQIFINKKGVVEDVVVLKGIPGTGLNEAAIDAVKEVRFKPAKQRDLEIGVWMSLPIHFRLKEISKTRS